MNKICEYDILKLLEKKHKKDIFVSHCKTGPTWCTRGMLILDAWVMKRSWLNPCIIGYEIKTNRRDFLNDKKWKNYLDYCNVFYFVCPPQIIQEKELPKEVGLYYTSKNIKTLYIQKSTEYRNIIIPEEILKYVLICRATIEKRN